MVHIQAGVFLAIFCMAELSIFVDESGHFDMHSKVSPYYIVSFVFLKSINVNISSIHKATINKIDRLGHIQFIKLKILYIKYG